ncbi:MAG: restriction endonuclease subunit S [Gammaproteobacteria bacterium]|nr:restriction endonuclease subunit S [Gammaproteobacteria bacterium]
MEFDSCLHAPSEWRRVSIDSICSSFTSGGTPSRKKPEYFESGVIPWVKTKELLDCVLDDAEEWITEEAILNSSAKRLPPRTLLMAMYGATVGQLGILGREMACNQACAAMVVDDAQCDYRFLYYQLLANRRQIVSMATGAAQQNLSGAQIKRWILPLPDKSEQQRIVAVLWSLDERISLLRETNATLEAIAQALFKSWFVDFDPVRAKAEGREPEGMDAATAALFPSKFQDSELGPIPKGWMIRTVADIATVTRGRSYKSSDLQESSDALVTLKSFHRGGGFRRDGFKPYTGPFKEDQVTRVGDCIVAYTDVTQQAELIGRSAIVEASPHHDRLIASLDVGIVRPLRSPITPEFLRRLLSGDRYVAHVKGFVTGTTVLHLAKDGLPSYTFALPQDELIVEWCERAQLLADRRAVNSVMLESLSDLRDTLLPRLISGRLQPSEAASECVEA